MIINYEFESIFNHQFIIQRQVDVIMNALVHLTVLTVVFSYSSV